MEPQPNNNEVKHDAITKKALTSSQRKLALARLHHVARQMVCDAHKDEYHANVRMLRAKYLPYAPKRTEDPSRGELRLAKMVERLRKLERS